MKQPRMFDSARMQVTLISFIIIMILAFFDNNSAGIAIPTIGTITVAVIGGKTVTDHRQISYRKNDNIIGSDTPPMEEE